MADSNKSNQSDPDASESRETTAAGASEAVTGASAATVKPAADSGNKQKPRRTNAAKSGATAQGSDAAKGSDAAASADAGGKQMSTGALIAAYIAGRFGVFLLILLIFQLIGFRGLPGALAAAIVSIPVSFYLFAKMRLEVTRRLAERKEDQLRMREEFRTAGRSK